MYTNPLRHTNLHHDQRISPNNCLYLSSKAASPQIQHCCDPNSAKSEQKEFTELGKSTEAEGCVLGFTHSACRCIKVISCSQLSPLHLNRIYVPNFKALCSTSQIPLLKDACLLASVKASRTILLALSDERISHTHTGYPLLLLRV